MIRREEGAALLLTLFVLVVLGIVSGALLFVATQEAAVVDASLAATQARLRARSAAHLALATWTTESFRDLPVGASRSFDPVPFEAAEDGTHQAEVERLAGPWFLVRAAARSSSAPHAAMHRVGLLVRAIDPREPWTAFPAAVSAGSAVELGTGARIIGDAGPDAVGPDACAPEAASVPAEIFGNDARPGILVPDPDLAPLPVEDAITGAPPIAVDSALADPHAFDRLGPFDWEDLQRLADRVLVGTTRPGPRVHNGECDLDAPDNWGDPLDPDGPCGEFAPLVYAPGDLRIAGGAAQGILAVAGDLALDDGARFHGAVFVRGRLQLAHGAVILGAVRAGAANGPVTVGGDVAYDACALWRAFTRSPALNRPFRQGPRTWVPIP